MFLVDEGFLGKLTNLLFEWSGFEYIFRDLNFRVQGLSKK